jgi:hypothetical protein
MIDIDRIFSSKRDGLEKAVYRIEQAIKKHKTNGARADEDQIHHLKGLLETAQNLVPEHQNEERGEFQRDESSSSSQKNPAMNEGGDDSFSVHDAENPLQLLARASDLTTQTNTNILPVMRTATQSDQGLRNFFGPFRPSLDNEADTDPIEMGLVTLEETSALFT